MKVGFIGLGRMGAPMSGSILAAGYDLVVHDLRREAAAGLLAAGAQWAPSPQRAGAGRDVVITMLPGPRQVEEALLGRGGLLSGLPAGATATTGMDALTHALESIMSRRANPWSDGIAWQVVKMIGAHLPRAVADGADRESRAQMLLAAHLAGVAMATTGLGVCHAIGHSLGGRYGIPHGVALTMVLPAVLRFNRPACGDRLASVAFALGVGNTAHSTGWNAAAAIEAITALAAAAGMAHRLSDFGITPADFGQIAADALDDDVLANTPRMPTGGDIRELLAAAEIA